MTVSVVNLTRNHISMAEDASDTPPKKRLRWSPPIGGEVAFKTCLKDYLTTPTNIAHQDNMDKSTINSKMLLTHAELMRNLQNIQNNLSFTPMVLKTVLMRIAAETI